MTRQAGAGGGVWALVPFKGGAGAKRRLEAVLSEEERGGLARAMLRDVLVALAGSPGLAGVLLVSRDADVHAFAAEVGGARVRGFRRGPLGRGG